jgi:DNA-3-methyladenine glycosylase
MVDASRLTVRRERLAGASYFVAPRLLGALVASEVGGQTVVVRVTEVEAYHGADDPASHAYRGETPRNRVMFGPAGFLYTYFTYGMHWCANVVCGVEDQPTALLLRAGEVVGGIEVARERRTVRGASRPIADRDLARGPARLASCLALAAAQNGADLCRADSPVRLVRLARQGTPRTAIATGPRVGISTAVDRPWRFWLDGDPTVSVYRAGGRKRVAPTGQTD